VLKEGSLLLFKGKPAVAMGSGDKADIRLEGGGLVKVREKDVILLHPGPLKSFDAAAALERAGEGDFDTARSMLEAGRTTPAELADLVYGSSGPDQVWAAACHGLSGEGFFRMEGDILIALGDGEISARDGKRREREGAALARSGFISRARAKGPFVPLAGDAAEGDARFLQEIEARAAGAMASSRLLKDMGLEDLPESAHAFLLRAGVKGPSWNPHPLRMGLSLKAPEIMLRDFPLSGREDLRGMEALAIDNAWSNDPDDAVSFHEGALWVHVADPASSVLPGSEADREARARAATLYLPEGISPMLPDAALERFGLGLGKESPALSFRIALDGEGLVEDVRIMKSVLGVRRLTYEAADAALETGTLAALGAIAERNRARRAANGAVEISLPEARVRVEGGAPEITPIAETKSSGIVRECMVLAGEGAARFAFREGIPFPYYGQEAPAEGRPAPIEGGLAAEYAKRRLMRAGMISGTPVAHQGLGLSLYTQATSPLRRYQDLLAHQQLSAWLGAEGGGPSGLMGADDIIEAAGAAQARSAQVRMAERLSLLHWKIVWLELHRGESLEGVVVAKQGQRSVVLLPRLALETQIALGAEAELNSVIPLVYSGADLAKQEIRFQRA
jgi:exoribonuclease II